MINIDTIKNGKDLELFTASYYQAKNYYVDCNLKWIVENDNSTGKVDIFEVDILAKFFWTNSIKTILIECKRGCTFNDIFKFSGVAKLINADENILVCQSQEYNDLKKIGSMIDININCPENLIKDLCEQEEEKMLFFYSSNIVSNLLFDKETIIKLVNSTFKLSVLEQKAYNSIRSFLSKLIGKVWRELNLIEQSKEIKILIDSSPDYIRSIARTLKLKPGNRSSEFYMNLNFLCQTSAFLVLKLRISYIICAVNCAISLSNDIPLSLDDLEDDNFINVVNLLKQNIHIASKLPNFLQEFIFIFGGIVSIIDSDQISIANYMRVTVEEFNSIIEILKKLFYISERQIQWGFNEDLGVLSLKYIPITIKGLGIKNRESLSFSVKGFCFSTQWKKSLDKLLKTKGKI